MWKSNRSKKVTAAARPVRIAYLIPEKPAHELLNAIFSDCLSRWGGRRSPIIPTNGRDISKSYWNLLDYWDADVIYSYYQLDEPFEDRLFKCFAPAELVFHKDMGGENFKPEFNGNVDFLSSLSYLPFLARRASQLGLSMPMVVDNESLNGHQDFADTFGFVSESCLGVTLRPYALRISSRNLALTPQNAKSEATYHSSEEQWIDHVTRDPNIHSLNKLSDLQSPYLSELSTEQTGWNDHLSVIIGDTVEDRLLMWNAIHRYRSLGLDDDICVLRVSPTKLVHGIPDWLFRWITERNTRQYRQVFSKRTYLRSISKTKKELEELAAMIKANVSEVKFECHETFDLFDLPAHKRSQSMTWSIPHDGTTSVKFFKDEFEIPPFTPWHLEGSNDKHLSHGVWAADLVIERNEDHSSSELNPHTWKFPRRLRLERHLKTESYGENFARNSNIFPRLRPSREGHLVVWDSINWTKPTIHIKSDISLFIDGLRLLDRYSPKSVRQRKQSCADLDTSKLDANKYADIFSRVQISDKGRDLLGVLQYFRSLPEALSYLTDPYWLKVIEKLLPENVEDRTRPLKLIENSLRALSNVSSEDEIKRIAKRALELAGQAYSSSTIKVMDFDSLYELAKIHFGTNQDRGFDLKEDLVTSLTYLRNREFLHQGFHWKCKLCEHHNWSNLSELTPISICEICHSGESSPVHGSLHFKLNPFAIHAFSSSSAQQSVIWALDQLYQIADSELTSKRCFSFAPALDIFRPGNSNPWTDIDLTCNINGQTYLVEVKRSFAGVNEKLIDQLKELGKIVKPDFLILAVQAQKPIDFQHNPLIRDLISELKATGVEFKILIPCNPVDVSATDILAGPFGEQMEWTGW